MGHTKQNTEEEKKEIKLLIAKVIEDAKAEKESEVRTKEVLFDSLNYYLKGRGIVISNTMAH